MLACLEKLAVHTGKLAARGPVFITLDDVQWADGTTIKALRELPTWLAEYPVGWVLGVGWGRGNPPQSGCSASGSTWERIGSHSDPLPTMPSSTSSRMLLRRGRTPTSWPWLAVRRGNPLLVRALLDGLRDEGGVAIAGGRARLLSGQPPGQVREVVHDWVMRLSPLRANLLEVAASLDRLFGVDDLAEVLGWSNEQVRPPLHEIVAADLLTTVEKDVLGLSPRSGPAVGG